MGITIDNSNVTGITIDGVEVVSVTIDGVECYTSTPAPTYTYLYNEGVGENNWSGYYYSGSSSIAPVGDPFYLEEASYLRILAAQFQNPFTIETLGVYNSQIDVTSINTIYVEWEVDKSTVQGEASVIMSSSQFSKYNVFDVKSSIQASTVGKEIIELDVSGLSGNYYLRIHSLHITPGYPTPMGTITDVYKVYY